jgi:hypothetical protein
MTFQHTLPNSLIQEENYIKNIFSVLSQHAAFGASVLTNTVMGSGRTARLFAARIVFLGSLTPKKGRCAFPGHLRCSSLYAMKR